LALNNNHWYVVVVLFSNLSARYRDYQSDNELDTLTFIVATSMWSFLDWSETLQFFVPFIYIIMYWRRSWNYQ